jgi:D-alanine-D-alanine ligase-like ATP-grasp enzyme
VSGAAADRPGTSWAARTRRGRSALLAWEHVRLLGGEAVWKDRQAAARLRPLGREARDGVYSRMWRTAAERAGAEYRDLGRGISELLRQGRRARMFQQLTPLDDAATMRVALDKPTVQRWLADRGVSVPEQTRFSLHDLTPALDLIQRSGSCVVKPAEGTAGGDGVTVGVADARDLHSACLLAGRFGTALIAERQAPGPLWRLLFLDDELLDVICDEPPHVVGDGTSSIGELMQAENRRRDAARGDVGLEYWRVALDTALTLRRAGARLSDVPAPGTRVQVKSVTNDRRVEDSRTYRGRVHPDVLDQARTAAAAVGLRLAGVDVVAPGLDAPLAVSGGVVLEVNGGPGIHRHYQVADPAGATDVATVIAERLLS